MKNLIRHILLPLGLVVASVAYGAVPSINVMVSDAKGKVAFKGRTSANGTFATGNLAPGSYVVQFNSNDAAIKGSQYALVVSAGKKKVTAGGVAGAKFGTGGVAMKVDVGAGLNITGQVVNAQAAAANPNVKIIKGKRFVWVKGGETGSNLGGHWVEEGSPEARNITTMSTSDVNRRQEHADAHQEGFGGR